MRPGGVIPDGRSVPSVRVYNGHPGWTSRRLPRRDVRNISPGSQDPECADALLMDYTGVEAARQGRPGRGRF